MGDAPAKTGDAAADCLITKSFRLRVQRKQARQLNEWCGVYRWTYNQCVQAFYGKTVEYRGKMTIVKALRSLCVNRTAPLLQDKLWVLKVPYDVRDGAVLEFAKNLKTEFDKRKKDTSHTFRLKYKSRMDASMALPVYHKHWKDGGVWFHSFLGSKLRGFEKLPKTLPHDAKLVKTRFNKYTLCVPVERTMEVAPATMHKTGRSIALDPGVRTFMTGYDPSGTILEIGKDDSQALFKMCTQVDQIMAKVSLAKNHKQRYQRKRAAARARDRIRNRIKDLHCKLAKHLCETYSHVFLPKFSTQQMVRRAERKLHTKTARMMLTFSHYAFQQRLLNKAKSFTSVHVHIVDEAYTSKTCTRCGAEKVGLGGNKVFNCRTCDLTIDRDINGARNIYIRSIQEVVGLEAATFGAYPPLAGARMVSSLEAM
jgi:putative transposase